MRETKMILFNLHKIIISFNSSQPENVILIGIYLYDRDIFQYKYK